MKKKKAFKITELPLTKAPQPEDRMIVTNSPTPMMLLPAAPGVCAICATKHDPLMPHNQQSIHYQYWFYASSNGRWPTWADAMAHCTDEVKKVWIAELDKLGITVDLKVKPKQDPTPTGGEKREFELNE